MRFCEPRLTCLCDGFLFGFMLFEVFCVVSLALLVVLYLVWTVVVEPYLFSGTQWLYLAGSNVGS